MAKNPIPSQLDPGQIVKRAFDDADDALRVQVLSAASSSTAINDGVATAQKASVNSQGELAVAVGDPTSGVQAAVKSASVAPLATDPALVVSISPNSSLSVSSNGRYDTVLPTLTNAQLSPVELDVNGRLLVSSIANALPTGTNTIGSINNVSGVVSLPTGASTEATLSALNTKVTTTANGVKVDGTATIQPISAASLPLPTGASTSAKQPTLGTAGVASTDVLTVQGIASMTALKVDGSAVTQPVSGTVTANQGGAPWSQNLTQLAGSAVSTGNGVSGVGTLRVNVASDNTAFSVNSVQSGVWSTRTQDGAGTALTSSTQGTKTGLNASDLGYSSANAPVYNDYTVTAVTTAAYVQLVASTTSATQELEIFDSSGQAIYLATGAAASEVNQIIIPPGGNGRVKLSIPAGTRVSAKAVAVNANVGFITINFYG